MTHPELQKHCPEVERMLKGKKPFITRHGITIILAVLVLACLLLLLSDGMPQRMTKEIILNVIEQMKHKF